MYYSICVVTFEKRFHEYFLPLLNSIKSNIPDVEIIVAVNGEYKKSFNENYRRDVLRACSSFSATFPQLFTSFTSLAKLWNRSIQSATNRFSLVLNDDVSIQSNFFNLLESSRESFINNITLFNNQFSHFMVDREFLANLNWFDERFLGVGKEDRDIERKITCNSIDSKDIYNYYLETTKPIENMRCIEDNPYLSKYSSFNTEFFYEKWDQNLHKEEIQYPYYSFEKTRYNEL